jgi:Arc/MetJ family transcription regulator
MYILRVHVFDLHVYNGQMKTHIELDDELLEQVFQLGGFATKKAAVNAALAEYAKFLKRRELLAMRGEVRWEGDLAALRADRRGRKP